LAKDEDAAQAELRRVKRKAQKNQRVGDPRTKLGARYMMIVTSLDAETYPAADVLALYRLRWQIELAFKRLKSLLHLDRLPAKNKELARAWLNAHLMLALLIDEMTQQALDSPPCAPGHGTSSDVEMEAPADNGHFHHDLPL
jgi:IS4 transposase